MGSGVGKGQVVGQTFWQHRDVRPAQLCYCSCLQMGWFYQWQSTSLTVPAQGCMETWSPPLFHYSVLT